MTICKQCVHYLVCMHYSPERKECTQFQESAKYVEVVRCKDCVHRKEKVCFNPSAGMWVGVELKDDDFCSYGERREGE